MEYPSNSGSRSAKKALFWASVVQCISVALYVSFSAVSNSCGVTLGCFAVYLEKISLILPAIAIAGWGLKIARSHTGRYHKKNRAVFSSFALVCFIFAAGCAFLAVNFPFSGDGLSMHMFQASTALLAAMGIISMVIWQFLRKEVVPVFVAEFESGIPLTFVNHENFQLNY